MAGTVKILNDINNTREEISHIVDLLTKKRDTKIDIVQATKDHPVDMALLALMLGLFSALVLGRIQSLLKLIIIILVTKQSISCLLRK